MISEKIKVNGDEYYKGKKILGNGHEYIEYINEDKRKLKFFEIIDGELQDIVEKEDLKNAIKNNYETSDDIVN